MMASSYIVFDVLPTCNEVSPQEILRLAALKLNNTTLEPEAAFLKNVDPQHHIHTNNESCALFVGAEPSQATKIDIDNVLLLLQQWVKHNQDPRKSQTGIVPVPVFSSKGICDIFMDTISKYDIRLELGPNPIIVRDTYAKHFSIGADAMLGTRSIYHKLQISEDEDISEESPFFMFRHRDLKVCRMTAKTLKSLVEIRADLGLDDEDE
ncbi:uncharacterized protein LOC135484703 [Lineus longissimus]|uniref:uncharacterized protein LOC135484703 n=1 Tax=Lineus longissimus TaxID=88925 RepID=UPI00315D8A6C